jgi:hypothetical protein
MIVKRIGVMSCGKLMAFLYAGLGLLIGSIYALVAIIAGVFGLALGGQSEAALGGGMLIVVGLVALVAAPLFYGMIGFVGGIIGAALYNLAANYAGGIEIEVE